MAPPRPLPLMAWPVLAGGWAVLLCGGCACLRFSGEQSQLSAEAGRLTRQASAALSGGSHRFAQRLLQRSLQCCPDDPQALALLAEAELREGEPAKAIATLTRLVKQFPERTDLRVQLGQACLAAGQVAAAREQAEAATQLSPEDPSTWQLRSAVAEAENDPRLALGCLLRAAVQDGAAAGLQLRIACLHQQLGEPAEALAAVEHYLHQQPAGSLPCDGLLKEGELLMELGHAERAIERLTLAASQPAAEPEAFVRLSQAWAREGQTGQARQTLLAAKDRWPEDPELDRLIGLFPVPAASSGSLAVHRGE